MLLKIPPIQPRISAEKKMPKFSWWRIRNWRTYCGISIKIKHFNTHVLVNLSFKKAFVDIIN
jgi:hypothetical protein